MGRFDLKPGEEEFPDSPLGAPSGPRDNPLIIGGRRTAVSADLPDSTASDAKEDAWAHRVMAKEMRERGRQEKAVWKAASTGQKVETDDPGLQDIAQFGEETFAADRKADRRQHFMIGVGAVARGLARAAASGGRQGRGPAALGKASKRRY